MKIINNIQEMRESLVLARQAGSSVGFVPTMGYLHAGHASLLKKSVSENDITVLSIFINKTQFNNPTDLYHYPKDLTGDLTLAGEIEVDYVFIPTDNIIYPDDFSYKILENNISLQLEGKHRPGHFEGVLTVVLKLLNIIEPARLYLGEKDYQQLSLIQGMINAFFIPTEVIACETIREESGLAMSSRNSRLTADELLIAPQFYQMIRKYKTPEEVSYYLTQAGFMVDYIEDSQGRRFGAVHLGAVRLIDNISLDKIKLN